MSIPEVSHGLRVAEETVGNTVVLRANGEVDMYTTGSFAAALRAGCDAARQAGTLVIDLTGIRFFSAAGLTLLVTTQQHCRERQLTLRVVATHRSVLRPLQITGLDTLVDIVSSLEEATRSRASRTPRALQQHAAPSPAPALAADAA